METAIIRPFADGEYRFWLPLPQVFEIERTCETSILSIEEKLRTSIGRNADDQVVFLGGGGATVKEILAVVRCGLIGGNHAVVDGEEIEVGPVRAKQLLDAYAFPSRPLVESAVLAWGILDAAVFGVRLKKKAESPISEQSQSRSEKDS